MNNTPVSATVYIWYPWGGNFGHASMYIGDPNIGRWVEYACDRFSISGRRSVYNSSYISWWPSVTAGVFDKAEHQTALFLKEDVVSECARPHVVYTLHGLNEQGMRTAWLNIRDKPNAHYQLLRKSCAKAAQKLRDSCVKCSESRRCAGKTVFGQARMVFE